MLLPYPAIPATTPPSSGAPAAPRAVQIAASSEGDRPRAHGEDVANDSADSSRSALVRFDERRVVVRLDLEDRGKAVTNVDRTRVFPGPCSTRVPVVGSVVR